VVKNGSNTRARTASSMPTPVSATLSSRYVPGDSSSAWAVGASSSTARVAIVTRPPSGIASRALTTRFMMTCSTWPRSISVWALGWSRSMTSLTSSPISRCSMRAMPVTSSYRSHGSGDSTCLRLKARSCRVRPSTRRAAACTSLSRR
jgi:hypothetical protein